MTIHSRLLRVSRAAAKAGGLGILLIAVMVTVDVLLRKIFAVTLGGATEIAGFIFAVATALSYPFVLLDRANIRIDVIYTRLSTPMRAFLDVAALLVVLYFVGWLTNSVFALFAKSWNGNSTSVGVVNIPLWVPQLFWVLGFALFTVTALFLTVYALTAFVRRDWITVNRIAGVPSLGEMIEDEADIEIERTAARMDSHESRVFRQ